MVKNIVKKINNKKIVINLNSVNYIISLQECDEENNDDFYYQNYELKEFRKNDLKPEFESKEYFPNIPLKEIINKKIGFISKNPMNIMLIESYEDFDFRKINKIIHKKKSEKNKSYNIIYFFKCIYEFTCFYNLSSNMQNYIW